MKRIMVDMSATLLHHGHVRLLKEASAKGAVIVALTTDEEILGKKGYEPELSYEYREEILLSIKYVDEVVARALLSQTSWEHARAYPSHRIKDVASETAVGSGLCLGVHFSCFPYLPPACCKQLCAQCFGH